MSKTVVVEVNRSAKTGQFVTERYTKTHPTTTVTEHYIKPLPPPPPPHKKK